METTTETKTVPAQLSEPPQPRFLTDEEQQAIVMLAGRYKDDHGFIERGRDLIAEYRQQVQEEWEREINDEDGK